MQSKIKVRVAVALACVMMFTIWFIPSYGVLGDYQNLLAHSSIVQVSVITLWVPVGMLGASFSTILLAPKALFHGKKFNETYSRKTMQLVNRVSLYFALAGVAFAAGWTYHSIALLDKYGYVYSRDLTKITPTGVHLMYVKAR
ncbi:TPA: hypothetical protein NG675_003483 [Vibrio parahaemolyticus]|uniref:hypothetical protein n=1 Tax=Vibrio parahaemolyticus TaxID=670 RepID=UPI0004A314AA|nr:hypothetical protein [Vibrio parahaemolyticus]EGR3179323.1 hypothetical protein [Vibrio parahaemolyticus]EIE1221534.1 hypothetical protein [Vibrio parahaemolyticus]EIE1259474.1 hypothetical protein [Vibrio parahaemolyticus]EIE1337110.1 hypothetical protein [Vibrio parahaemolyticus]EIZ1367926.1 hypothetical protein [Vibrio parahaemolyticus]